MSSMLQPSTACPAPLPPVTPDAPIPAGAQTLRTLDDRTRHILERHRGGSSYRQIAEHLRCTERAIRYRLEKVPSELREQYRARVLPMHRPAAPKQEALRDEILALRRQGLSIRQLTRRLAPRCGQWVIQQVLTGPKWRQPAKRARETAVLQTARDVLRTPPLGAAVALTAEHVIEHAEALTGVVTQLIAVERAPEVFAAMTGSLSHPLTLPVSLRLGDFWEVCATITDPIAFLDYDGMGQLPEDLPARLSQLAPRLTSPYLIRLTCALGCQAGLSQITALTGALQGLPGLRIARLDLSRVPCGPQQALMLTAIAALTR